MVCQACSTPVDHFKKKRVEKHVNGPEHTKKLALFLSGKLKFQYQPSLLSTFAKVHDEKHPKEKEEELLDSALREFRIRVLTRCFEAGLDPEKIAKISDLLSTPTHDIPSSASSVRDHIPMVLKRLREALEILQSKYLYSLPSLSFPSCFILLTHVL